MVTGSLKGFSDKENLVIDASSLEQASYRFGKEMKDENDIYLKNTWGKLSIHKKRQIMNDARDKLKRLEDQSKSDLYIIDGENKLEKFIFAFKNYCKGSGISEEIGVYLQIDLPVGCQSIITQDSDDGEVRLVHSEEDTSSVLAEGKYSYRWVQINLPEKSVAFFAYPGLCCWGPAFGINLTKQFVQTIDDLMIKPEYDLGYLWANIMSFIALDVGDINKIKHLIKNIKETEGPIFVNGYAMHMAQVGGRPLMLSVEFANDSIEITKPLETDDRKIVAQSNCPLNESIKRYSDAAYPDDGQYWNRDSAELYVEMEERRKRLTRMAGKMHWLKKSPKESIEEGLRTLADPRGDLGRYKSEKTGRIRYYSSGLPSRVMVAHLVVYVGKESVVYYVGKKRPAPIKGMEYKIQVNQKYKYTLKKIWLEASKMLKSRKSNP